jgi:hypothetical protein
MTFFFLLVFLSSLASNFNSYSQRKEKVYNFKNSKTLKENGKKLYFSRKKLWNFLISSFGFSSLFQLNKLCSSGTFIFSPLFRKFFVDKINNIRKFHRGVCFCHLLVITFRQFVFKRWKFPPRWRLFSLGASQHFSSILFFIITMTMMMMILK